MEGCFIYFICFFFFHCAAFTVNIKHILACESLSDLSLLSSCEMLRYFGCMIGHLNYMVLMLFLYLTA